MGKRCSEVEKAYAAGFLDADGAIMATIEKHREKKFGFRVRVIVKITQRDQKILNWFLKTFRVGKIRQNRTAHDWLIRDQKIVAEILGILMPYLKVKKFQAQKAIKILESSINSSKDLYRAANLADALSRHNVRSNGRRKNFMIMIKEHCSRND